MFYKRYTVAVVLMTFAIVGILITSGCGVNRERAEGIVTLRFAILGNIHEIGVAKELVSSFEKKHPGIRIRMEPISDYLPRILTQIAGGTAPDVMWVAEMYIPKFASRGALMNLESFIEKDEEFDLNDFYSIVLDLCRYKGNLYAFPREFASVVMFYNKTMFDKYGIEYPKPDWTWNDFLEVAKRLTKDTDSDGRVDHWGYIGGLGWQAVRNSWIWQGGGSVFNDDLTECTIDSPEAVKAVQFVTDLVTKYHVSPLPGYQDHDVLKMFKLGKLAMFPNSRPIVPALRTIRDFQWDVTPLPTGEKRVTLIGTCGYAISSQTRHPEEAWKFLKYIVSDKGQTLLAELGSAVPSRKSIATSDVFLKSTPPESNEIFLETIEYGRPAPIPLRDIEIESIINRELELVLLNKQTVLEACKNIKRKVDPLLKAK